MDRILVCPHAQQFICWRPNAQRDCRALGDRTCEEVLRLNETVRWEPNPIGLMPLKKGEMLSSAM